MNTTENNKLIAEFIGLKPRLVSPDFYAMQKDNIHITGHKPEVVLFGFSESAKYHSDWNWLIEVIKKCREKQFFGSQQIISTIDNRLLQLDLLATYSNVVEFIKMYNLQNK